METPLPPDRKPSREPATDQVAVTTSCPPAKEAAKTFDEVEFAIRRLYDSAPDANGSPRSAPVTRFFKDLAEGGGKALAWEAMAVSADSVVLGSGSFVRATREAIRVFGALKSFNEGHGVDLRIPVLTSEEGFALGMRIRLFEAEPQQLPDLALYASFDIQAPAYRNVASVERLPRDATEQGIVRPAAYPEPGQADLTDPMIRHGVRWLEPVVDGGRPGAVVVAPRAEIRGATDAVEVDAEAVVGYLDTLTVARDADRTQRQQHRSPAVVGYADPDTGVGLLVVNPTEGPAYSPVVFQVDRTADGGRSLRFWVLLETNRAHNELAPRTSASAQPAADAVNRETARAVAQWPRMLRELADRFEGTPEHLVQTAIVSAVVEPTVMRALSVAGSASVERLHDLGAHGVGLLAEQILARSTDAQSSQASVLKQIISENLASRSEDALALRSHLMYLLAGSRWLEQLIVAARRDASRGPASELRWLLLLGSTGHGEQWHDDARAATDDALVEWTIEQLEVLAAGSEVLRRSLDRVFRRLATDQ